MIIIVLLSKKIITFLLKKKTILQEKLLQLRKKPDCVDVDGIGNVGELLRLVFINEECENLKVVVDGGELTRNINEKKRPVVLQAYRCPLCDKCERR